MDNKSYKAQDLVQYTQLKELMPHFIPQISCMKCQALYNPEFFKIINYDTLEDGEVERSLSSRDQNLDPIEDSFSMTNHTNLSHVGKTGVEEMAQISEIA